MNVTISTIVGKAFILREPADFLTSFVIAANMCTNVKYFTIGKPSAIRKGFFFRKGINRLLTWTWSYIHILINLIKKKVLNTESFRQYGLVERYLNKLRIFIKIRKYENGYAYILGERVKHISWNFTFIIY